MCKLIRDGMTETSINLCKFVINQKYWENMPYVSMFFGIIIRMFFSEHNPPHFHAEYQGAEGIFDFQGNMVRGNIKSAIALKLIREWALLRTKELDENWNNILNKQNINKIEPLQ